MNDNYETQRTIEEVFDLETGEIVDAKVFFKKPESEIITYRRRLQEAIDGYTKPKYVCLYCNQLLKLSGLSTRRGLVSFFAHLHDSDDCEIKTDGNNLSKEQIEILKYSKIRESERHKDLKNRIYRCLTDEASTLNGVKDVAVEKRIVSKLPYYNWRQPDISFEYGGKKIVLELQLSTTFLSVVVERDIFYKMNEIFIIWVFNFSENQQYVNLGNLMCKDIYYANKRNAFIFDEKAMELSKQKKELILKCVWFEPNVSSGKFDPFNSIRKEEYVSLSDLNFDDKNFKPYYVDSDLLFEKHQPSMKFQRYKEEIRIQDNLKKQIELNNIVLTPYNQNRRGILSNALIPVFQNFDLYRKEDDNWGFKNESGHVAILAQYKVVFPFKNGIAWVQDAQWGAIDTVGRIVINFQYKEIRQSVHNDLIIATNKQGKSGILSNEGFTIAPFEFDEVKDFIDGKVKVHKNYRWGVINDIGNPITENKVEIADNVFKGTQFGLFGLEDLNGRVIVPFEYYLFEEIVDGKIIVMKDNKYGIINIKGETVFPLKYELLKKFIDDKIVAKRKNVCGVINLEGESVIPFKYYSIEEIFDGYAIVSKKSEWGAVSCGVINQVGKVVIPFEYRSIVKFFEDKYRALKQWEWGVINLKGETVIPFEYESIGDFIDGKAKANKNKIWGYIDENGTGLISDTTEIKEGINKGHKFGKWGIESNDGKNILPFEFDVVKEFIGGQAEVQKDGKSGVINLKGETIIPCVYDFIAPYKDGVALCYLKGNFKIERSPAFKTTLYTAIVEGIASFGVFLNLPSLSKQNIVYKKVIKVKGLLHISEINKANKRINEYAVDSKINLYINYADEDKQRLSFSINPSVEEGDYKKDI